MHMENAMLKSSPQKTITVFSEGVRHEGVRTKLAFAWIESKDQPAPQSQVERKEKLSEERARRARDAVFKSIAGANWSQEDKRKFRKVVTAMSDSELLKFERKLRHSR